MADFFTEVKDTWEAENLARWRAARSRSADFVHAVPLILGLSLALGVCVAFWTSFGYLVLTGSVPLGSVLFAGIAQTAFVAMLTTVTALST